MRFDPVREARCGSFKQVELGHCSPHREGEIGEPPPSWRLPTNEGQLCPRFPAVAWVSVVGGQERVRLEAVGEQDHRETKFALPQGTFLPGLPRFVSPGQPVHVPTSELKMEHRPTSVMGTKNNLDFSLCPAYTQ